MDFITQNWLELLLGIMAFAKVVTNLTPTDKDNRIFGWLDCTNEGWCKANN